jgi:hypothetical protein
MVRVDWTPVALLALIGVLAYSPQTTMAANASGEQIYRDTCAKCHGPRGEGVAGKHDEPLCGDRSLPSLTRYIDRTMPEDDPDVINAEESARVAKYIFDEFYSPQARARVRPARLELSRLTVQQYLNVAADLLASFRPTADTGEQRGLVAQYHNARNFRRDKKVFERTEPRVDFSFGEGSPTNSIATNEFAIRWRGSVIADDTGDYEFRIKTENGARLWVNSETRGSDFRGPSKRAFIDAWVSSGAEVREHKETIRLIGGRAYPIQLDFFKYKDKTASIVLEWKPPHKAWQTIPESNLSPVRVPEVMVVNASFPPDDRSVGYERGTAVSKAWDQAATYAAIEVASKVVAQLEALSGVENDTPHRDEHLKLFCEKFAERAFRRPLTREEKRFFIHQPFGDGDDVEGAVKRVVLLVLKSPRFLYHELGGTAANDYAIAARLSFALWDGLPDQPLLEAAASGNLRRQDAVAAHAARMIHDPRARAKIRGFFGHWLKMEEAEDLSKDPSTFPDFNDTIISDLRTSLEVFLDHVLWSEKSDYRELLLADYLFVNGRLARFYGLNATGETFQKVSMNGQRSGVLTHPYLLSAFAYHKSSSPIHRGVFLIRNIVGRSLKPPPMAIEFMDGRFDPSLTMREKVSELTRPAACQGCHSVINPLGFSLEHFDAVGRFRTTENKKPIDVTGEYTSSEGATIRINGARDVANYAASSREAQRGFVKQLFQHMIKQAPDAYGSGTLESLIEAFGANNFQMRKLIQEIAARTALHALEQKKSDGTRDATQLERKGEKDT